MRFILFNDDSNNSTHAASNDAAVGKSFRKKCRTKIACPNIKNCDSYLRIATEQNSELPPSLNRVLNSELPDYEYEC
jgi:hypothetical protein